jgi:hypothetical protein
MGDVVPEQRKRVPAATTPSLFPIDETSDRITGTDGGITGDLIVVGSCRVIFSMERYRTKKKNSSCLLQNSKK